VSGVPGAAAPRPHPTLLLKKSPSFSNMFDNEAALRPRSISNMFENEAM